MKYLLGLLNIFFINQRLVYKLKTQSPTKGIWQVLENPPGRDITSYGNTYFEYIGFRNR
jgi:hypothetical protein